MMMRGSDQYKLYAAGLGFAMAFLGVMISEGNTSEELSALAGIVFALIAMKTGWTIFWVVYAGIMLSVVSHFATNAHAQTGGHSAGNALLLLGVWMPALTQFPANGLEKAKASLGGILSIVGTVFVALGFVGAILFWSEVKKDGEGAGWLGLSFELIMAILLFLRASWWDDAIWKRLAVFFLAWQQVNFLEIAVEASEMKSIQAGATLGWLALVGFIVLLVLDGQHSLQLDSGRVKSLRFILLAVCLLLGIIGGSLAHKQASKAGRWLNAVAVLAVALLMLGSLAAPDTGRPLFQHLALAFTFAVYSPLFTAARNYSDADMSDETGGYALMILAIQLGFVFQAELSPDDFRGAFGRAVTERLGNLGVVGLLCALIGIAAWGHYAEDAPGGEGHVGFVALAFLSTCVFVVGWYLARFWAVISLFCCSMSLVFLSTQVSAFSDPDMPGKRGVGQWGSIMVWIAHVIYLVCLLGVLPRDYNAAAEGQEGDSVASGWGSGASTEDGGDRLHDPLVHGHEDDAGVLHQASDAENGSYQRYEAPKVNQAAGGASPAGSPGSPSAAGAPGGEQGESAVPADGQPQIQQYQDFSRINEDYNGYDYN